MRNIILVSILTLLGSSANAQRGYSSGSVSMNRANGVLAPDQVIIEEYINYHTHKIDLPQKDEELALSLGYNQISEKSFVFQIGIASKQLLDYSEMPPINVSLVIDRSGSMQSDNKLEKVKKALSKFLKGLRPNDYISIVAYESEAKVILQSQKFSEVENLESILENLVSGGSTNLYDGLILGYKEVEKHFNSNHTNKVILLTDGIANVGVTDTEKITESSYSYNIEGIDISTIGVGNDLNYSLLQQIARRGKGANHFVGNDEEDIIKVFDEELESLLSPIAKQVYLELEYPAGIKVEKIFGYTPEYKENHIKIPLNNISSGLTQVILIEVSLLQDGISSPIKTKLNYFSSFISKNKEMTKEINLKLNETYTINNNVIMKNFYIGKMAESLKEMARKVSDEDYDTALQILDVSLKEVEKTFPHLKDKDMIRVKEILLKNKIKLEEYITAHNKTYKQ